MILVLCPLFYVLHLVNGVGTYLFLELHQLSATANCPRQSNFRHPLRLEQGLYYEMRFRSIVNDVFLTNGCNGITRNDHFSFHSFLCHYFFYYCIYCAYRLQNIGVNSYKSMALCEQYAYETIFYKSGEWFRFLCNYASLLQ